MVLVNILSGEATLPEQHPQGNDSCSGTSHSQMYVTGNILKSLTATTAATTTTSMNDNQYDYYSDITKAALGDNGGFGFRQNQNDVGLAMSMIVHDFEYEQNHGDGKKVDEIQSLDELKFGNDESKNGLRNCLMSWDENQRGENFIYGYGLNLKGKEWVDNIEEPEIENGGLEFDSESCDVAVCKGENGTDEIDRLCEDENEKAQNEKGDHELKVKDDDEFDTQRVISEGVTIKNEIDNTDDDCNEDDESSCDDQSNVAHDTDYDTDMSIGDGGSCLGDDNDDDDSDSDIDVQSFLAQLDEEIAGSESNNPAIDKGYAWIVVFAVFLIQAILLGYLKSGGIFFVEFQRQFESTASMTSLIIGLVEAIFSLSSPFVLGFLIKVWSVRQMCLAGSFVFVAGVVGNSLFDRIEYLLLTHSFCFGIANGLVYGPSIYIINEYFKEKRALALSIATTGASFGGIAFPFLARTLFDNYGFAGGIVMTGGVIMQIFIGSVLLIPVKHHERKNTPTHAKDLESNGLGDKIGKPKKKIGSSIVESFKQRWIARRNKSENDSKSKIKLAHVNKSNSSIFQKHQSHTIYNGHNKFLGTGIKSLQLEQFSSKLEICEEGVPLEIQSEYHTADKEKVEQAKDSVSEKKLLSVSGRYPHFLSDNTSLTSQHSHLSGSICSSAHHGSSRHRLDVYHGNNSNELGVVPGNASSLLLMSKVSSSKQTLSRSMMFQSTSTLNNTIADIISIDQDFKRISRVHSPDIENEDRDISTFRRMCPRFCNSPLLRSASFWAMVPYYFTGAIGVGLSQIFILPLAKERGLTDDQAAFCLSLLNMLDVIAHLAPGIILNCGFMTSTTVGILPMIVVGIVGHLTPFFNSYESIMVMAVTLGLCMGFFYALQSLVVIDILGIENYTSSIGIYYLVCGMGGAVSYPIAGALKDMSGTYTTTYQYVATMQLISVVIMLALPFVRKCDVRRGVLKP